MSVRSAEQDSAIVAFIQPYKDSVDREMNEVIGLSAQPMYKNRPEGLLGNFSSDAVLLKARDYVNSDVHFCLLNHGGLRAPLPSGELTMRNMFELMPFDNLIVVVELTGEQVLNTVKHAAKKGGEPISGAQVEVWSDSLSVKVLGEIVDVNQTYTMATSDYLANGGDGFDMLPGLVRTNTKVLVRTAMAEYVKELDNEPVTARLEGRFVFVEDSKPEERE
jgi:2',3'-cyclic-nucleotide 2'-phosphodiesterase (5'-nucleotidase family)